MDGEFWQRYKLPAALGLIGIVLIIGGIFSSNLTKPDSKDFPKESIIQKDETISVDVSGAVNTPGVYKVLQTARVEDAINAAGGFSQSANQEYISKYINLAQKLVDGTKVYVPFEGETISSGQSTAVAGAQTASKVNINTASQSELEGLPGVGPVTASKIISGRPYQKIEDLLGSKIVGKSVFDKIKDSILVY